MDVNCTNWESNMDICRKIYVLGYTYIWNNRENKTMNSNESGERYMKGFGGNKCKE